MRIFETAGLAPDVLRIIRPSGASGQSTPPARS